MSTYLKTLVVSLLAVTIVIGVLSCDQKKTEIDTTNCLKSTETIEVRVHIYENDRQVTKAYQEHVKRYNRNNVDQMKDDDRIREGFAWWFEDEPYYCDVHVTRLRYLEDPRMTTWGHEFAHCVCRSYHKDGQR